MPKKAVITVLSGKGGAGKTSISANLASLIAERLNWIDERFCSALENFSNETERGLTLFQSRRMLREQVWQYCVNSSYHRKLLTLLINALNRAKPKSITKEELSLLRENISLLAKKELTNEILERAEDVLLTIE